MLREAKNCAYAQKGMWFWKYYVFVVAGKFEAKRGVKPDQLAQEAEAQQVHPVLVGYAEGRTWWWFHDRFWWEDEGLSDEDVKALVLERERRQRRKLERAHAAMHQVLAPEPRREVIPQEVRLAVWKRDGGRCRECGTDFDLQYDHIIPFSMGGATSVENLQLLCGDCNRAKSRRVVVPLHTHKRTGTAPLAILARGRPGRAAH
jgi:5-methylcytosine-specific restriction endonuclease McrA